MEPLLDEAIEQYAADHTEAPPPLLERLEAETRELMSAPQMLTGRVEGQFLRLLVSLVGAKRVLEVGMFTGYSALMMASALPEGGELHTCEVDPNSEAFARRFFEESPDGGKIRIHMGAALETIAGLEGPFDFAFVDADKENYPNYFEPVLERMRPGGVIAFDNTLWSGAVVDPRDDEARAIHRLNGMVQTDARVENVFTTIRDGILLARKR